MQDKSAQNVGCLIIGALLFGIPFGIAVIVGGDEPVYWILAIAALIVLIPLGVWFEHQTVGRR
jgi:hypothetical protein